VYKHLSDHNVIRPGETVFGALEQSSIPVCPKLIVASNRIDRDMTRAMLHAEKMCQQPDRIPWSEGVHLASRAVRFWNQKDLQDCRAHAAENRQKFLSKLIEAAALQNDMISREKALKRQLHVEAMKSYYKKLRSALRPNGLCGGITKVEVKVNETLVAYTEKADVHRKCLNQNRRHFNQVAGTPFTIYPLSEVGTKATKFKMDKMPDGRAV
jgi:hypothetical protein